MQTTRRADRDTQMTTVPKLLDDEEAARDMGRLTLKEWILAVTVVTLLFAAAIYGLLDRRDEQDSRLRDEILPARSITLDGSRFRETSGVITVENFTLWITAQDGTRLRCKVGKFDVLCRRISEDSK